MKVTRTVQEIKPVLTRIRKILEGIYGKRLADIILYGSFARNTPNEDSDIDIAVVLKGRVDRAKEIDRICDALYEVELQTGELISVNPLSEDEIEDLEWPLYHHIKTGGIRI